MSDGERAGQEGEVEQLRRRLDHEVGTLDRLIEIAAQLNSTLKLEELLELILSAATELLGAETSSLLLLDEETGELTVEVATGEPGRDVMKQRVPPGVGIVGFVLESNEPLVVDPARDDPRFYSGIDEKSGFETRSILAVPMTTRERAIGVIEVINKVDGSFDDQDVKLATALAAQAGIAIENARLYARLADAVVTSRLSYRL